MEDEKIYNSLINKNQNGLTMVLDCYGGLISYIVRNTINPNDEDHAECMSDILYTIWNRISKFDSSKSSFKSWIVMLARGCSIDYARKHNKQQAIPLDDVEHKLFVSDDKTDYEHIIYLMQGLTPPDNEILYRKYILGQDVSTIAFKLNETKSNIYKRISRAKSKLKVLLLKEGFDV